MLNKILILAALLISSAASAANLDANCFGFNGVDDDALEAGLYVVQPGNPVAFTCPPASLLCNKGSFLIAGDQVVVARIKDGQACAEFKNAKKYQNTTAGWLPMERLAAVSPAPDWSGRWVSEDRTITAKPQGEKIRLDAKAEVELGNGTQYGRFAGLVDATQPTAKFGYFSDSDKSSDEKLLAFEENPKPGFCEVKASLLGPYLVVNDNHNCGGINVSFGGVYRHAEDGKTADRANKPKSDTSGLRASYTACLDASGGVTSDVETCIDVEFKFQDTRLNKTYQALHDRLGYDGKIELRDEERRWIAERHKRCEADDDDGTGQTLETNDCSLELTAKRAAELESR